MLQREKRLLYFIEKIYMPLKLIVKFMKGSMLDNICTYLILKFSKIMYICTVPCA